MKPKKKYPKEWNKETILGILEDLDTHLAKKGEKVSVTAIGGVVIVLKNFQERSTNDLDLAPVSDAATLLKACHQLGINAQIVTLCSTVDFNEVETTTEFKGKVLTVKGIGAEDLIRCKLERFAKHDPEDIYAIIQREKISYKRFENIVSEGKDYFVGRIDEYMLSAQLIVERMYPQALGEFCRRFGLS